jgi:N-acetyl-anhydromuramyl-L-alanine amidase AmpD
VNVASDDFIPAKHYKANRGAPIRLIVLHTTENTEKPGTARAVARWFASDDSPIASAHYIIDDKETIQCVPEWDTAWASGIANPFSLNIELVGRAAQNAVQWDDDFSKAVLARAAVLVGHRAKLYNIPLVHLKDSEVREGTGICDHHAITMAWAVKGGHWDVGEHFPWEGFIAQCQEFQAEYARLDSGEEPPVDS